MELDTLGRVSQVSADGQVAKAPVGVLFGDRLVLLREDPPESFGDLNLDQVVAGVVAGREKLRLEPLFYTALPSVDAVAFRHEVFRDLEDAALLEGLRSFGKQMIVVRRHLTFSQKFNYPQERQRWFLDAARQYSDAVTGLASAIADSAVTSRALVAFADHLSAYVSGAVFTSLGADAERVLSRLDEVVYSVHVHSGRVQVSGYDGEPDYSIQVRDLFARFQQSTTTTEHRERFTDQVDMNHVEGRIIELVAKLFPTVFGELESFGQVHAEFLDPTVVAFDRDIQFFMAYLDYIAPLRSAGLTFCYPKVSQASKSEFAEDAFDLALASSLVPRSLPVVTNDFELSGPERIVVVTGPNQGGKTTFARMVGQLHHLAAIGCPVPAGRAELLLVDQVLTHFEREESLSTGSGKLQDDLLRIRSVLERSTGQSLVVLNEIFTSTTLEDALFLGTEVLRRVIDRDLLCICVTFVDELSRLGPSTVSMVSTVTPEDPTVRTFKVVRTPSDGRAYAVVLAAKYGLTYEQLHDRLGS